MSVENTGALPVAGSSAPRPGTSNARGMGTAPREMPAWLDVTDRPLPEKFLCELSTCRVPYQVHLSTTAEALYTGRGAKSPWEGL